MDTIIKKTNEVNNQVDKIKIIISNEQVKQINTSQQFYFLGGSYKCLNNKVIVELSGKLFPTPEDLGGITANNMYDIPQKLYDEAGLKVNEDYFFNEALVGIVHVKKDIYVEDNPTYYLSELREQFKSNTDKYDVYKYGKLKYINGLSLIPKAKSAKYRYNCYMKYDEIRQNRYDDFGYFDNFDYKYLEKIKHIIRFECQYSNFAEIRKAFYIDEDKLPTILNIMACEKDVVANEFNKLLQVKGVLNENSKVN